MWVVSGIGIKGMDKATVPGHQIYLEHIYCTRTLDN